MDDKNKVDVQKDSEKDTPADERNIDIEKKKRKKHVIVFLIILGIITLVSLFSLYLISLLENRKPEETNTMYSDGIHSYIFEKPHYGLDVTTVKEYMERERSLNYTFRGVTESIDDVNGYGRDVQFFKEYFDTAIAGDHEKYNTLFTDHYYESNNPMNEFSPQMIYDINIKKLDEISDDGVTRYKYDVWYKIYKNDGTFRNDINKESYKVLYFELVETDEGVRIDRITYYKKVS